MFLTSRLALVGLLALSQVHAATLPELVTPRLARTRAEDIKTLLHRWQPDLQLELRDSDHRLIIHDAEGKDVWSASVEYGTGPLAGLPTRLRSENGLEANLAPSWQSLIDRYTIKREAFHQLRPTAEPGAFNQWFAETENIDQLLLPVQAEMARFVWKSIRTPKREPRQFAPSAANERSGVRGFLQAFPPLDYIEFGGVFAGLGVAAFGVYKYMTTPYSYYAYNGPAGASEIYLGMAITVLFTLNSAPFFFGRDDSILSTVVNAVRNQLEQRARNQEIARWQIEHAAKKAEAVRISEREYQIGPITLALKAGSLTEMTADAWVVPQLRAQVSDAAVGAAVLQAGGKAGLDAFATHVHAHGALAPGAVVVTDAGPGLPTRVFIHAATLLTGGALFRDNPAASFRNAFTVARDAYTGAIHEARARGLASIATPELGVGLLGSLNSRDSLSMLLEAVNTAVQEDPATPLRITVAIYQAVVQIPELAGLIERAREEGVPSRPELHLTGADKLMRACEDAVAAND